MKPGDEVMYFGTRYGADNAHRAKVLAVRPQGRGRRPLLDLSFVMASRATGRDETITVWRVPPAVSPPRPGKQRCYLLPEEI